MKKLETIVTLIQKPTEVEFTCPCCKADVSEDFEEFLDNQGLSCRDFPDWEYELIKCPFCEAEIEAEYEFDWGGRMNNVSIDKIVCELSAGRLYKAEKIVRQMICKTFNNIGIKNKKTNKNFNIISLKKFLDEKYRDQYREWIYEMSRLKKIERKEIDEFMTKEINNLLKFMNNSLEYNERLIAAYEEKGEKENVWKIKQKDY